MDEQVYSVPVCAECGRQLPRGNHYRCPDHLDGEEAWVSLIVGRNAVLGQINPRQYVVENAVYFGCWRQSGHYFWRRASDGAMRNAWDAKDIVPWGHHVDGGLFPRGSEPRSQGDAHVFHKDGWTALAFPDNTVDRRPGSWSVFCLPATYDGPEALEIARDAFPEVFDRYTFDIVPA
jgi:hypothetical protein